MELKVLPELKNEIPPLSDEEFGLLQKSIEKDGIRDPLVVWQKDGENILVDGHNRYELSITYGYDFAVVYKDFEDLTDAKIWIRNNQMARRNLTDGWKAELALRNKDDLLKRGREKMQAAKQKREEDVTESQGMSETDTPYDNVTTEIVLNNKRNESHSTRKQIADELKWSTGKVAQAEYVKKNSPENWELAKTGDYSINKAYEETKKEETKRQKKDLLEQKKKEYEERIEEEVELKDKKYRIVYADPPWRYNDKQEIPNLGGAGKHYNTMSVQELCEMNISKITEKDAVLFLWVTSPLLEESFEIIKAWGFKYKSSFVWDKVKHNMGHYNSVRHEFLLIATKGSCTPDEKKLYDSVQSIERTNRHSEKPKEFREIIDTLYVYGERIELFAREKHERWDVYGNEVAHE